MEMRDLEQAVYQAIVEYLADRVVEKLLARRKSAVVLLTGTDLGLEQAAASIQRLRDEGWALRFVLSAGARQVLTPGQLGAFGDRGLIAQSDDEGGARNVDAFLDACGLLIVPTLSITVAAKVACGIRDGLASRLLARALERGLPVVAALDGCCPDNRERAGRGFLVADAYKARLRSNLEALQSYGIRLVRAAALASAAHGAPVSRTNPAPVSPAAAPAGMAGKRIFGRNDAVLCRDGELRLGRDVLVTPLAADELRIRNIRLIQA